MAGLIACLFLAVGERREKKLGRCLRAVNLKHPHLKSFPIVFILLYICKRFSLLWTSVCSTFRKDLRGQHQQRGQEENCSGWGVSS